MISSLQIPTTVGTTTTNNKHRRKDWILITNSQSTPSIDWMWPLLYFLPAMISLNSIYILSPLFRSFSCKKNPSFVSHRTTTTVAPCHLVHLASDGTDRQVGNSRRADAVYNSLLQQDLSCYHCIDRHRQAWQMMMVLPTTTTTTIAATIMVVTTNNRTRPSHHSSCRYYYGR